VEAAIAEYDSDLGAKDSEYQVKWYHPTHLHPRVRRPGEGQRRAVDATRRGGEAPPAGITATCHCPWEQAPSRLGTPFVPRHDCLQPCLCCSCEMRCFCLVQTCLVLLWLSHPKTTNNMHLNPHRLPTRLSPLSRPPGRAVQVQRGDAAAGGDAQWRGGHAGGAHGSRGTRGSHTPGQAHGRREMEAMRASLNMLLLPVSVRE
jgi:hypothetical protein